jgi:adenylate cyclase
MISKEKLIIRFNLFLRNILYQLIFWYCCLLFYVFITGNQSIFNNYFDLLKVEPIYFTTLIVASCISLLFAFLDVVFSDRLMRFSPIRILVFLRSIMYFTVAFLVVFLAPLSPAIIRSVKSVKELIALLPEMDIHFFRFFVYFYISCFVNDFLKKMMRKIGKGNFRNWIFGMLNKPREEERIFMFIDMKSSTTIAEKLLHVKFSHLVQDVFNDLSIVDNYDGNIYQYLGDGAIISWSLKKGIKNSNCIKSFYAFSNLVNKREKYYQRKYGLKPKFKAGIHVGKVMVLQVGRVRRDISYNGDTLNTAARIESMCNEYKQSLLISGDLYDILREMKGLSFKEVGNIMLKGKKRGVDIYQVKQSLPKKSPKIKAAEKKMA